jgi:Carboxypeptidase regulatory-like domain
MRILRLSIVVASIGLQALPVSAQQVSRANAVAAPAAVPAGSVTLSLAEYNRLVDLSARPARPPDVPPVSAVLARADLRLRVDPVAVRGSFTFEGEVLRAGATRVDLMREGTVLDARAGGRPIPLVADNGRHAAVVTGPGAFSIGLDWAAPLKAAPGRASFALPVPAAGSVRAAIDLPGEDVDVRVIPGLVTRKTSAAGRTIAEVTLDPGSVAQVSWSLRPTASAPSPRDARLLADVMTLVTIGESEVRLSSLVDVTVMQGGLRSLEVALPPGYEVSSVTGTSIDTTDQKAGTLTLVLNDSTLRRHQFLVALERPSAGGSFSLDTGFPSVPAAERERGEIAVEGVGTLDLAAPERPGIRRVDVREINPALASLARQPLASAFRYRRQSTAPPSLALDVQRFPDAAVLAAVAERAVATTLVNPQGRSLTEIVLTLQNRAQSFLKVEMPQDASIVSVEVAGHPAKPATASDGIRVPLLRPGLRTNGPYTVSFVYVHTGTPFARKGEQRMLLPKMDIPVGVMQWEVFVPEQFSVSRFGGNMITADLVGGFDVADADSGGSAGGVMSGRSYVSPIVGTVGEIVGRVTDASGAVLPGVTVTLQSPQGAQQVVTTEHGTFRLSNVPSGQVTVKAELPGFRQTQRSLAFNEQSQQLDFVMEVATVTETVTLAAEPEEGARSQGRAQTYAPSQNVTNLQRKASGVLPVRMDVPRAGSSLRFVKPLIVDQEAIVSFRYKRK